MQVRSYVESRTRSIAAVSLSLSASLYGANVTSPSWLAVLMASVVANAFRAAAEDMGFAPHRTFRLWGLRFRRRYLHPWAKAPLSFSLFARDRDDWADCIPSSVA